MYVEVQRHDDQELLKAIVQRLRDLLAGVVLGQRQVPRHSAQLLGPVFQFVRALLEHLRRALRSVMSVMNAKARGPPDVGTWFKLTSIGNVDPSLRSPVRCRPPPIRRGRGAAK